VTIVTLSSHTVEKTLPTTGHPRTVVSTQNSQFGKVYVASPDSPYLTILRTDLDIVDTTVLVEGNIVDVRGPPKPATSAATPTCQPQARLRPALLPASQRGTRSHWRTQPIWKLAGCCRRADLAGSCKSQSQEKFPTHCESEWPGFVALEWTPSSSAS
jgi:hypothetical protein